MRSTSSELNPKDPLVNTASEYMYQMATISYHTLNGSTTVVLDEDAGEFNGEVIPAGTYEFAERRSLLDRLRPDSNPIEGAARGQIWTGTAHALIAELGVGSVTASALQLGLGMAAILAVRRPPVRHHRPRTGVGDSSRDRRGQGPGPQPAGSIA